MKRVSGGESAAEIKRLKHELAEAQATLAAIRAGEVDAVVVGGERDLDVYTLERADLPFHTILEQMPEGVVSLAPTRTILYCNAFFRKMIGITDEAQLRALPFAGLIENPARASVLGALEGAERSKIGCNLLGPDGEPIPVDLTILPLGGSRRRATIIVSDLRVHRNLDLLAKDRDAARAEIHAKDTFLATLGHELRNPLAALAAGVSVLRGSVGDKNGRPGQIVDSLDRQVRQLTTLVNDLLDATRIARGKITLRPRRIVAKELIDGIVEVIAPMLGARRHELRVYIHPPDLTFVADPTRIEQILVNLLTNAGRYSEDGSKVTLSVQVDGTSILFRVQDTGIGLAADDLERIFEPFAQVVARGQAGGLGIGLSLVRKLAELHGGTVRAESAGQGHGSTFSVSIPLRSPDDAVEDVQPAIARRPGRTVLLVDDNIDATEMVTMLLEEAGLRVHSCSLGSEALELVRTVRPDLVLLDLGLGDMSGLDVARQIRQAGHTDLRIIAATGYSDARTMADALSAGFDGRLVKPISLSQILAELPPEARA